MRRGVAASVVRRGAAALLVVRRGAAASSVVRRGVARACALGGCSGGCAQ